MYHSEKIKLSSNKVDLQNFRAGVAGFAIEEYIFYIAFFYAIAEIYKRLGEKE